MAARKIVGLIFIVLLGSGLHVLLSDMVWEERGNVRRNVEAGYVFPSRFTRIMALGHKGLYADFLFLKTATFYGEKQIYQQAMTSEDLDFLVAGLDAVTDLDPYFLDPYVLAEGTLTWSARRFEDANRLLEKGMKNRAWDWQLPYYLGFNHFYFLKDYNKGAEYLMEASRRPGSPNFLPQLAARLSYYGDQAKTGVLFLTGMVNQTDDERLKASLLRRKKALEGATALEEAIERYTKAHRKAPDNLNDLVSEGYIDRLPEEPYGGTWVILRTGRVFSTSKFVEGRKKKDNRGNPAGNEP